MAFSATTSRRRQLPRPAADRLTFVKLSYLPRVGPARWARLGRRGIAGAALVVLPLTTACQTRIGEAATFGDHQVTTSSLTSLTQRTFGAFASSGHPVPAAQQAGIERSVLNLLIQAELLRDVGAKNGVSASKADIATERATEAKSTGGEASYVKQLAANGISAKDIPLFVERSVLIQKLQAAFKTTDDTVFLNDLIKATKNTRVRINPRFGGWDPKTLTITGAADDTLSSTTIKK